MAKEYGFFKNIPSDYPQIVQNLSWNFLDHCMWPRETYKKDLDGEIAPFYDTGYYTPENTQLWQTRADETALDVDSVTQQVPIIDHTVTFIKLDPGHTLPWHRDAFYLLKQKRPNWKEQKLKPIRFLIFLEDWKLGHFVQLENTVVTHWKSGDCWYFCNDTYHLGTNAGLEAFVSMQVSGFKQTHSI